MTPPDAPVHKPRSLAHRIVMLLDRVVAGLCWLAIALSALALLASLGMIVYSVAMRYVLNAPQTWVDSLVGFLLVAIVMLGAADVMRRGEHIGVDLLTNLLGETGKRIAAVWALVAVIATAVFFVVEGWETVSFSKMLGIKSHGHLEVPIYLVQLLIPAGGALLGLAALSNLLRVAIGEPVVVSTSESGHARRGHEHGQASDPERGSGRT